MMKSNQIQIGYNPSYQYTMPAPVTVVWKKQSDSDKDFVSLQAYANPITICDREEPQMLQWQL